MNPAPSPPPLKLGSFKVPHCPICRVRLESNHLGQILFLACHNCGGALMPLTAVHHAIRQDVEDQLLARIRATRRRGPRNCPRCSRAMTLVTVPRGPQAVGLDICYPCSSVWFDAREAEVLQVMYGMEEPPARMLDHKWKWAVALLGMPVTQQSQPVLTRPWLTWSLAALIVLVSAIAWSSPVLLWRLSLIPASAGRMGGATFLTCFFLHAGIFHLLANMYFLIVFGAQVEDYLGRPRYVLLLLLATLTGNLFHAALDPHSNIPLVGASGGISGLVVFYGLQFPRVRLLILTPWLFFFPVRLRASVGLLIWIALHVFGAWTQVHGFSRISSVAHLGGAAIGFLFWWTWRPQLDAAPHPPAPLAPR